MLHVIILRVVIVDTIVGCFTLVLANRVGSEFTGEIAQMLPAAR